MTDTTAAALVAAYCGWHIAPERQETLTVNGSGSSTLMLPTMMVSDVLSVTSDDVTLDPTTYDWSTSGIIELRYGCFSSRLRGVSVELIHGFAEIPVEVQALIAQADLSGLGPQAVQVGQVRVQTAAGWMSAESILDPYRIPQVS